MMGAPVMNATSQFVAQCRAEPIVLEGVRPDLCPALEQIILGRMQSTRGPKIGSLNVGGWKSGEDFFSWSDSAVQELRGMIVSLVEARAPIGWAMVNRAGSHHPRHQHRAASLTGIYYVTTGSAEAITPTIFECEGNGGRGGRYELEVEPHPGRLVLFRGETWHRVPIYPGDIPRITVAFDVRR